MYPRFYILNLCHLVMYRSQLYNLRRYYNSCWRSSFTQLNAEKLMTVMECNKILVSFLIKWMGFQSLRSNVVYEYCFLKELSQYEFVGFPVIIPCLRTLYLLTFVALNCPKATTCVQNTMQETRVFLRSPLGAPSRLVKF